MTDEKTKKDGVVNPAHGGIDQDIKRELATVQDSRIEIQTSPPPETDAHGKAGYTGNPQTGRRPYTRSGNYTKEKLAAAKAQAAGELKIEEAPVVEKIDLPIEAVRDLIKVPFDLVALWRGDHWRVEDKELYSFESPLQRYLESKMPEWLKENLDAVLISQGLARLVAARIIEDRKNKKETKP